MFGLTEEFIDSIKLILKKYSQIEKVIIYGSRAKGNYKAGSDIDLTLVGNQIDLDILNSVAVELDDLMSPYTFDLSIYKSISNKDLLLHIERIGKIFFENDKSLK